MSPAAVSAGRLPRCRLCTGLLDEGDNYAERICQSCAARPDAGRLLKMADAKPAIARTVTPARGFTVADRALITHLSGFVPVVELLRILNERLVADQGAAAVPFTLEQLHQEVTGVIDPGTASDWAGVRQLLVQAEWLRVGEAAVLAGVSVTVVQRWGSGGEIARRRHPTIHTWRYHRRSVRQRARAYWAMSRFIRDLRPAWLVAEGRAADTIPDARTA